MGMKWLWDQTSPGRVKPATDGDRNHHPRRIEPQHRRGREAKEALAVAMKGQLGGSGIMAFHVFLLHAPGGCFRCCCPATDTSDQLVTGLCPSWLAWCQQNDGGPHGWHTCCLTFLKMLSTQARLRLPCLVLVSLHWRHNRANVEPCMAGLCRPIPLKPLSLIEARAWQ